MKSATDYRKLRLSVYWRETLGLYIDCAAEVSAEKCQYPKITCHYSHSYCYLDHRLCF